MAIDKDIPDQLVDEMVKPKTVYDQEVELEAEEPILPENIQMMDDGGAEINFGGPEMMQNVAADHDANLAEFLEDTDLSEISTEVMERYEDCKSSREDWATTYEKGLELLGFKYEDRAEPFRGASGATHPVLAEAVTQFQALAYKELFPAGGPVRTQIMGIETPEKSKQAQRVKEFMNYQLTVGMKEYEPEFDQMLFNLPLSGSTFKKVYYDAILNRSVSKFVPAEDLFVPYTATSLDDTETIIHRIKMPYNEIRKNQLGGMYRDVDIQEGYDCASQLASNRTITNTTNALALGDSADV